MFCMGVIGLIGEGDELVELPSGIPNWSLRYVVLPDCVADPVGIPYWLLKYVVLPDCVADPCGIPYWSLK